MNRTKSNRAARLNAITASIGWHRTLTLTVVFVVSMLYRSVAAATIADRQIPPLAEAAGDGLLACGGDGLLRGLAERAWLPLGVQQRRVVGLREPPALSGLLPACLLAY